MNLIPMKCIPCPASAVPALADQDPAVYFDSLIPTTGDLDAMILIAVILITAFLIFIIVRRRMHH